MAVDLRYPIVLEKLLEYYHQAHIARLPLWQQCNPHEPADGSEHFISCNALRVGDPELMNTTKIDISMNTSIP